MNAPIWAWHSGHQALVTAADGPDGKPALMAFPIPFLRACGFHVDPEGMRKSLPRFEEPPQKIITSAKDRDVMAVVADAARVQGVDRQFRGR